MVDGTLLTSLEATIATLNKAAIGAPYDEKVLSLNRDVDKAVKLVEKLRSHWDTTHKTTFPVEEPAHYDILKDRTYRTKIDQLLGNGVGFKRKEVPN